MSFSDASPKALEFLFELIGFVEQNGGARNEIEDGVVGAGDRREKLPPGKNVEATRANGSFDDFFGAFDSPATEAGVNRAEQLFADRSFGEWKEQGFIDGIRRALGSGVELANGIGFVAEEFDAEGAVGFRGIDIEDSAANGVLAGHLDDVG